MYQTFYFDPIFVFSRLQRVIAGSSMFSKSETFEKHYFCMINFRVKQQLMFRVYNEHINKNKIYKFVDYKCLHQPCGASQIYRVQLK